MNILYYGFKGSQVNAAFSAIAIFIGALAATIIVVFFIKDQISDLSAITFGTLSVVLFLLGLISTNDNRTPIIKATIDETVPFIEISDKYMLLNKEGEIYIFKVLNMENKEWEKIVVEMAQK